MVAIVSSLDYSARMPDERNLMTSEQRTRNEMLEGIFLPHGQRRRHGVYGSGKSPSARFVHYTSADAALKIINQKRLWMRNAACMTDYREVQHGFEILLRFFSDKDKAKSF